MQVLLLGGRSRYGGSTSQDELIHKKSSTTSKKALLLATTLLDSTLQFVFNGHNFLNKEQKRYFKIGIRIGADNRGTKLCFYFFTFDIRNCFDVACWLQRAVRREVKKAGKWRMDFSTNTTYQTASLVENLTHELFYFIIKI